MPIIIEYLLKLSISLSVVYLFYRIFLYKLTFYGWNRSYLGLYSLLAFIISFTNITPLLQRNEWSNSELLRLIPSVAHYQPVNSALEVSAASRWSAWEWVLVILAAGMLVMLCRLVFQYMSLYRIIRKARLLLSDKVKVYQVNEKVIPFSFGNSIFINQDQHGEEELKKIIRHEFIHVKQRHTLDILWGELLCIVNWYNPFAWMLRSAIRQNLEFIADHQVLENGIDRKQYQYLLLKVVGITQFSIAQQFNFSSLKKRIAMMNKIRSARIHLVKFLFLLPMAATLLLAFRNMQQTRNMDTSAETNSQAAGASIHFEAKIPTSTIDTTILDSYNNKGYRITVADNQGECVVIVKDRDKKIVEAIALTDWNKNSKKYEDKYGKIPPPPPPPPPPPAPPAVAVPEISSVPPQTPGVPIPPRAPKLPDYVASIDVNDRRAKVVLKNGTTEIYMLDKKEEKAAFEKKYGEIIPAPGRVPERGIDHSEIAAPVNPNAANSRTSIPPTPPGKPKNSAMQADAIMVVDGKIMPPGTNLNTVVDDPSQVQLIQILKGDEAIRKYGESGKNGAVEIITKASSNTAVQKDDVTRHVDDEFKLASDSINLNALDNFTGYFVIDGKKYSLSEFKALKLDESRIESISIWKGDEAVRPFGEKARMGVIEIKLKK